MIRSLFTVAFAAAVFVIPASTFADRVGLRLAQAEVVESSPSIRPIGQEDADESGEEDEDASGEETVSSPQLEMYNELQMLRQELQALRGQVEEQAHEIRQLKQRQMDDYVDLDRRISELREMPGSGGAQSPATRDAPPPDAGDDGGMDEFDSYSAAVDLATQEQDFAGALEALREHLEEYPEGRYAANAYYWMGQIHFVQGNMEPAREEFQTVVDDYPDHNKAPETRYKLGQVLFRLGEEDEARNLLEEVASGDSESAVLAENFLQQNF